MRRHSLRSRLARMLGGVAITCCLALSMSGCIVNPEFTVGTVVSGLDHPWDIGFAGNAMILTERGGRISSYVNGTRRVMADPSDVVQASEAGMMGLAIDPQFSTNRYIYTCFASTLGNPDDVRLVRWRVDAGFTALTNRTDIVTGMPLNASGENGRHSGCRPRFDGGSRLWVGTGDAASATVPQDPRSLGGKVLRINRDGGPANGNPGGALDRRIFSYGHRNVQGIAIRTGDGLGVSLEHGPTEDDELNRLVPGNFGWNPHVPPSTAYNENVPMTDLAEFPSAVGALWDSGSPTLAPSGATFVRGPRWGTWEGALVVALLKGSKLMIFDLASNGQVEDVGFALGDRGRLRSVVQHANGNLYISTDNGGGTDKILRVVPG